MRPPAKFWPWPFNQLLSDEPVYRNQAAAFHDDLRDRMTFCVGGIGSGKSTLIEIFAMNDVARLLAGLSNRGFLLIDVHNDLYSSLLERLAVWALNDERLYEQIILIDVLQKGWQVGLQPLALHRGLLPETLALMLADMMTDLYHDEGTITTRLRWLMYHLFLALICAREKGMDVGLPDALAFLRDHDYRAQIVAAVDNNEVQDYFAYELPSSQKEVIAWAESSLNRLGPLVTDPRIAPLLSGVQTVSFRQAMDTSKIILVNAPKGIIGNEKSRLLCGLIYALAKYAGFSRADIPKKARVPVTLYMDEAFTYITGNFTETIFEGRKMRMELFMAGQEVKGQLKQSELLSSVINTVDTHFCFRCGITDAELMSPIIFNPDFDAAIRYAPSTNGLQASFKPTDQVWFEHAAKLMRLPDRYTYMRNRREAAPHLIQTTALHPVESIADEITRRRAVERLLAEVGSRYGKPIRQQPGRAENPLGYT